MMLEYLIDENNIDMEKEDIDFIKSLIAGELKANEKPFLYDIVANYRNGVDVDKFDYLTRDCYNIGIKTDYDCSRLFDFSRVINDEICFQEKEVYNLYEMFHTRFSLHKRVYSHKVSCAIENMYVDALIEAEPVLQLSKAIFDKEQFLTLNDSIVNTIENSTDPGLRKSRDIIRKIRKRQLYKCVDEVVVPHQNVNMIKRRVSTEEIASFKAPGSALKSRRSAH